MRTVIGAAVMPLLALHAAGCSVDGPAGEAVAVRDSAGIRIVENAGPMLPTGSWSVSREPLLEVGGDESDPMQTLYRVAGAVVLSDGRIVVGNFPAPMVRWYGADGAFLTGTGRSGGGPGEFGPGEGAWIYRLWALPGDSVATWEHSGRRMQVFDPDGAYARAVITELPPNMPLGSYPQIAGGSTAGFVASLATEPAQGPLGQKRRDDQLYQAYAADGSFIGDVAPLPGFETYTREITLPGGRGTFRGEGRPPFSRPPASWVHEDRFYYGSAEQYEIAVYDFDGALRELIRKTIPNQPLTASIMEADRERRRRSSAAADAGSQATSGIDDLPYPETLPAYSRLRVDRIGWLWVQDYPLPDDTDVTWSVFDESGRWITELVLPRVWQIHDIGADYILAVVPDHLDIEHVRKYGLNRDH